MPLYKATKSELKSIPETTFGAEGLLERTDLQRLLRDQISVIDESLLVVAEEFGDWIDSSRRIDRNRSHPGRVKVSRLRFERLTWSLRIGANRILPLMCLVDSPQS